jgi:hypothetical protein
MTTPLINGGYSTAPNMVAPPGQPPPVGNGPTPAPVIPGNSGPATAIPSVPAYPANNIDYPSYQLNYNPNTLAAPGQLGPSLWVPPSPSTPGPDPGSLHAPLDYYPPPARQVNINPGGGIPAAASNVRWGGQDSRDFGVYKHRGTRTFDFGQEESGSSSQNGVYETRAGATDTTDLYGDRMPLRNNGMPTNQTIAPY